MARWRSTRLSRQGIDVIVLDIEMPVMDGLTAIPKLIAIDPAVKIIMASTLTLRGAEVSMKALQSGAADYVTKPSSTRELGAADSFKRELVEQGQGAGDLGPARRIAQPARPPQRAAAQRR